MTTTAPEATPVAINLDDFSSTLRDKLASQITIRNKKAETLKAVGGDPEALKAQLAETSEDPKVVKIREDIEKLTAAMEKTKASLDALLSVEVEKIQSENKDKVTELTSEVDEADKNIKAGLQYLLSTTGYTAEQLGLPSIARRSNRAAVKAGGPTDAKRVRGFDVFVDNVLATQRNQAGEHKSHLAAGAKAAGVDTKTMQEAFFAVAGKDAKAYPEKVEFEVNGHKVVCQKVGVGVDQ